MLRASSGLLASQTCPSRDNRRAPPAAAAAATALSLCVSDAGGGAALVSLVPPRDGPAARLALVAVIDTSWSTHTDPADAELKEAHDAQGAWFTKLDAAKQGTRVMLACLADGDAFGLVDASGTADVAVQPVVLDASTRAAAASAIDALAPRCATELWSGLEAGLELLRGRDGAGGPGKAVPAIPTNDCIRVLALFTDGDPDATKQGGPFGHAPPGARGCASAADDAFALRRNSDSYILSFFR